jgi:MFS family permease
VVLNRWIGALRERNFLLFTIGQTASQVGSGMAPVALVFAVLDHGTSTDVGYVLAAGTVPLVLFLLVGGVVADRMSRRLVMLGSDVLRALAEAVLGVWLLVGTPPLWGFMVLAAAVGTGQAFFVPAMTGLVPQLVHEEHLQQANAVNGLSESGGGIIGPALAGILVAASSPGWAIVADAVSYGISVLTLAMVRIDWSASPTSERFGALLRQGWREFWSRTWLWVIVIEFALVNMVIFAPFLVLGPTVAKESLGGARSWGLILAAEGAGAVLGGIAMLRLQPKRPLLVATACTLVWVAPLVTLAYRAPTAIIAVGSFLSGIAVAVFSAQWSTTMQREVPTEVLSRVSAYDWFGSLVFLPVGMVLVGPLADVVGITATMVGAAVLVVVLVGVVLAVPSVTTLRAPEPGATSPMGEARLS